MLRLIYQRISQLLSQQIPATGIGLFRCLYGLVTLQEIVFLYYFNHLIFDPIPFLDVEFPAIPMFLQIWGIVACCVTLGYRYQFTVTANYLFWLVFVNFTPMQRDFDGGFDSFMIGLGFFLLFMPGDRALSLDQLRRKLHDPFHHYNLYKPATVPAVAYHLPIVVCLGWMYFDSSVHKLFAEHWRNGLGAWLPATQPYYVSAIDMSPLLNLEWLQKAIGYSILVFQFTFVFYYAQPKFRLVYFLVGIGLHLGITFTLNIYPFGISMLICYVLLIPPAWWGKLAQVCKAKKPELTVFYDQLCPLCNRTVLILNHFDIFGCIDFKGAQDHASQYPEIAKIGMATLMSDLYALDGKGNVYAGVDTYRQILLKMRYLWPMGFVLGLPGIKHVAEGKYREIADSRQRIKCDTDCPVPPPWQENTLYQQLFEGYGAQKPKAFARKLAKITLALLFLQANSTLHYGVFYRLPINYGNWPLSQPISQASNALLMISSSFFGITPHALYLHDHFQDYDRILSITYLDSEGKEHWLPFVNDQGRLLAPNWGRVHSMWANIAVTPTINNARLQKFLMKVTAFWGQKLGINLNDAVFKVKMKRISAPTTWIYDLLHHNFMAEWRDIGTIRWHNRQISYELPEDLNAL